MGFFTLFFVVVVVFYKCLLKTNIKLTKKIKIKQCLGSG